MLRTLSSGAMGVAALGAAWAVLRASVIETRCVCRPLSLSHPTSRHHPPPGPAFGRPDDRLLRVIQYSRGACYRLRGRGVLGAPLSRRTTAECADALGQLRQLTTRAIPACAAIRRS